MPNKYGAEKVRTPEGEEFDSKKEYKRWIQLNILQEAGEINSLHRQVKYILIPTQRKNGKILERECSYVADFTYFDKHGRFHLEDTKSEATKTKEYVIKRKLLLKEYGIRIEEV